MLVGNAKNLVVKGQYTFAMLMAFIELINRIVGPIQQIVIIINELNGCKKRKGQNSHNIS